MSMFKKGVKLDERYRPVTICGPSRTKQEFREDCDINVVVSRYIQTGVAPSVIGRAAAVFADVSKMGSFHEVMNKVKQAQDSFMTLPPDLRRRFKDDPVELMSFVSNDANYDEAVKLGLIVKATAAPDASNSEPKASEASPK